MLEKNVWREIRCNEDIQQIGKAMEKTEEETTIWQWSGESERQSLRVTTANHTEFLWRSSGLRVTQGTCVRKYRWNYIRMRRSICARTHRDLWVTRMTGGRQHTLESCIAADTTTEPAAEGAQAATAG